MGYTIDRFAAKARISLNSAIRALGGNRMSVRTLHNIAGALGKSYEEIADLSNALPLSPTRQVRDDALTCSLWLRGTLSTYQHAARLSEQVPDTIARLASHGFVVSEHGLTCAVNNERDGFYRYILWVMASNDRAGQLAPVAVRPSMIARLQEDIALGRATTDTFYEYGEVLFPIMASTALEFFSHPPPTFDMIKGMRLSRIDRIEEGLKRWHIYPSTTPDGDGVRFLADLYLVSVTPTIPEPRRCEPLPLGA